MSIGYSVPRQTRTDPDGGLLGGRPGGEPTPWVSVLRKEAHLVGMKRDRVRVQVVRLGSGRAEPDSRLPKVDHRLALDLPFVPPPAPAAEVERFVDEHQDAERLLPLRDLVGSDA